MANWAIVIGVDRYWDPKVSLRGAVRDALAMRKWLTDVDGGAVPNRNLIMLLSPLAEAPPPDPAPDQIAAKDQIELAFQRLIQQSNGQGERLFFYFAGHGVKARVNQRDEDALVAANFTETLTSNSLSLTSVFEYFKATDFQQQFFFIDACRNLPWDAEYEIGKISRPRQAKARRHAPQQFIIYATSPGLTAAELREPGNERGAFTDALLEGLSGAGAAKAWDDDTGAYTVRWEALFKHVEQTVQARQIPASERPPDGQQTQDFIQIPRKGGEQGGGDSNPELARFREDHFGAEILEIYVEPAAAAAEAAVGIYDFGEYVDGRSPVSPPPLPLRLSLPPKTYAVRGQATAFRPRRDRWRVELYGARTVTVEMDPERTAGASAGAGGHQRQSAPPPPLSDRPSWGSRALGAPPPPASLTIESSDPLATLEIADASGRIVATGEGKLESDLKAGYYQCRLLTPENEVFERPFDVEPGERLRIEAPDGPPAITSRLVGEVVSHSGFDVSVDGTELGVSEWVPAIVAPRLSTILALAGTVAVTDPDYWGHRLKRLGVDSLRGAGVQVLLADEAASGTGLGSPLAMAALRLWSQDEPTPDSRSSAAPIAGIDGLRQWLAPVASPGPLWLSIQSLGGPPVVFGTAVLPGRVTLLVVHRDASGQDRAFQYMPRIGEPADAHPYPDRVRRSELVQRFYRSGRLDHAVREADELVKIGWDEPLVRCLAGYLRLAVGRVDDLAELVDRDPAQFVGLSDEFVLLAEYTAERGHNSAAAGHYRAALERGLPIFADGTVRLAAGVERHGISGARASLVERVADRLLPRSPWTVWAPRRLEPGQVLEA